MIFLRKCRKILKLAKKDADFPKDILKEIANKFHNFSEDVSGSLGRQRWISNLIYQDPSF